MNNELTEFFDKHLQDIYAGALVSTGFEEENFVENICDTLVDEGVIENYEPCGFKKDRLGIKVDAYDYSDENGVLTLIISKFSESYSTLTKSETQKLYKRLEKFFKYSLKSDFINSLEETELAYNLIQLINTKQDYITGLKFIVVSNLELSDRFKDFTIPDVNGINVIHQIWDLTKLYNIETSKFGKQPLYIDIQNDFATTIPCLKAFEPADNHQSYLFMLNGKILAELYENHGERLLEQNVRTFLQFRGNTNKGMRKTIQKEPELFFAFNNGLTATAESLYFSESNPNEIVAIKDLQIVNGGQTTASIFNTYKKDGSDLSKVYVQVKLTVVKPEEIEDLVPRISEFANTQNKVNAADFFSNSPFHREMEKLSRRLFAPSAVGSHRQTQWFYERARGQYLTAKNSGTKTDQDKFEKLNPRGQVITKTDLAKYQMSFEKKTTFSKLRSSKKTLLYLLKRLVKNGKKVNLALTKSTLKI